MTISGVTSSTDVTTTSAQNTSSSAYGQIDYMMLLATELQYQDPTEPMDTDQITTQTCMFSQLDELQNISDQLAEMEAALGSQVDPVSYLGQDVVVESDVLTLTEGESSDFTVTLNEPADSVIIDIYDAQGNIVSMQNWGAVPAGSQTLQWDGTLLNGETAPDGNYTIDVRATNSAGEEISSTTTTSGQVVSVANTTSGVQFMLDNGSTVSYTDIISVSLGEEEV